MALRIVGISYERTVNLGNYENERLRLDAVIEEGEDTANSVQELRQMVAQELSSKPPAVKQTAVKPATTVNNGVTRFNDDLF